jgi:Holliday junction resolvase
VKESDMLNRFNLNAGFETYLSIKTKGVTWQIGPQFRKQLFSTNDKTYSIEEKLLNYGLKIGVVKKL